MSKSIRSTVGVVAACVAFFGLASSALAVSVSPTGSVVGTASSSSFSDTTAGVTVSCTGSSITDVLAANGTGSIANGSATFSGCTDALLGSVTITQLAAFTSSISYNAGHPTLTVNVPSNGVQFSALGCKFKVGGSVTSTGASSAAVNTIAFSSASGLSVTSVDPVDDCFGIVNTSDSTSYNSSYGLNHTVTVSP